MGLFLEHQILNLRILDREFQTQILCDPQEPEGVANWFLLTTMERIEIPTHSLGKNMKIVTIF